MKLVAGNDSLEFLQLSEEEKSRTPFMSHNRQMLDQRADWTMRLLSSWGASAAMGDILMKYMDCEHQPHKPPPQQVPPQELVMRICEVVDAVWNEMQHRGWIVDTGSIGEK